MYIYTGDECYTAVSALVYSIFLLKSLTTLEICHSACDVCGGECDLPVLATSQTATKPWPIHSSLATARGVSLK